MDLDAKINNIDVDVEISTGVDVSSTKADAVDIEAPNIGGPRGNKGDKGETGAKGDTGDKGEKGEMGSMFGNYDELLENMTNVRDVPNRKPDAKPKVDYYKSGRVAVDLSDSEIYYPRIDIEVGKSGKAIGYSIADIQKFPQGGFRKVSSPSDQLSEHLEGNGRNNNISQIFKNVKDTESVRKKRLLSRLKDYQAKGAEITPNLKAEFGKYDPVESLDEIKSYHKKYGDDFYEKMPEYLQDDYEALLAKQPRDKNDVYIDPITGGRSIDVRVESGAPKSAKTEFAGLSDDSLKRV